MNEKYIPLYRKYRPQKLEELVGQEHIKNALTNAINLNKISHAYLFTGPRGTGKTSTARIFAKSLNCKNGPTINPCGECESCLDIANAVPMDVIEIDAASNRKVEDAQNILEKILYAPVYGKYKIYIIDEVHMLSNTAFNSLLKTLEEPPENVIFILATTEVHKVLDTIKSRCQRFDFRRITTDDIVKHLRYISDKEQINITDEALFAIAKNSAGGMRDSIALLDQLSVLSGEISVDDINKLLGRISFDTLKSLADAIITSNPQSALQLLENIYNSGNEPAQILTNFLDYLKNLLIAKNCSDDISIELTQLNEVQLKELKEQSKNIETHQIISITDKCSAYIKELRLTNNPRLWLEVAIIDMANLAENTKLEDLQKRLTALESGKITPAILPPSETTAAETRAAEKAAVEQNSTVIERKPAAVEQKPTVIEQKSQKPTATNLTEEEFSPMPKAQAAASDDISTLWAQIIENISSPPTRSLLKQWANPVVLTAEKVIISISSENLLKQFTEGNKRKILSDAINKVFGTEGTNLLIRLPLPDDKKIDKLPAVQQIRHEPAVNQPPKQPEEISDDEKIEDVKEEPVKQTREMHSDMVNMVVDLFDGKFME